MDSFIRGVRLLSRLCGYFVAGLIAVGVAVVCQMVFVRFVLIGNTIWQTDVVTYSLVAATFVGSPYVLTLHGCGFFIPPAAIILMTAPIIYPIITAAGFDPVWFGIILTINMEIGLIHPPVGLNIYIVSAIAPDVPVTRIMWGTIPYVLCMMLAIVILRAFPEIATWLPAHMMGAGK